MGQNFKGIVMDWDLSAQPPIVQTVVAYAIQAYEIALGWLLSPAAWSQFALLILSYVAAVILTRRIRPILTRVLTPPEESVSVFARVRRSVLLTLPLLLPVLAYLFAAIGEQVTRSVFGTGSVIAFGKGLFLFLAARVLVRDIITDPFLKLLGRYVLLPVVALYAVGFLDLLTEQLNTTTVSLGNISFSVMALLRGVIAGSLLFWLGRWSNDQSAAYINKQDEMRPATRQLAAKAAELLIFGLAFILLMNIMGVPLTSLAVLGGAIGVGLGFGLQKIASNYISGVILLLEGQATVGDYVELDNGEAGTIVKTTARAMILETFDGRWIVVPNEDFITTRVINYSDQGSANRLDVAFSVSYDTDINLVPDIIVEAVSKHPGVLQSPEPPDVELRGFGDSGIDFGVEFWVNGIDDGKNKYASDVLFLIWNALKEHNIEIPYPHRVVELRNAPTPE
jgi:small-conductance mechanosensitive channel